MSFISKFFGLKKSSVTEKEKEPLKVSPPKDFLGTVEEYFESLLTEEKFEGFTIERNVHVSRFDSSAHPACFPISFLFFKDAVPVLAVFLMNLNQYRSMIARGSYAVLDDKQIPYIRFFKDYTNYKDYVLERVHTELQGHK